MSGFPAVCPRYVWELITSTSAGRRPVVLVDGGSGSGKTSLARFVVDEAPVPTQLVSLDECYPGWDGLAEGSRMVVDDILRAERPGYRVWDWDQDKPGEWVGLDPQTALVVEGSGALTAASRALATMAVWLEVPLVIRKRRALERDGDAYAPHWDRWAAQEQAHATLHRPWLLADLVLRED